MRSRCYGALLTDWPRDVLALAIAHALDFHLGRRRMMRDRMARALPHWTAEMPGYASVLAMYAFALEENGQYRRAEKIAQQALTLDPGHPGAIHVVAHVMEMQGRVHDGLAFLAATESAWSEGTGLSVHLAWHRALFHLDANDPECALAIYDAQIATCGLRGHLGARRWFGAALAAQTPRHRGRRTLAVVGRSVGQAQFGQREAFLRCCMR